jgi:hypothetical protein
MIFLKTILTLSLESSRVFGSKYKNVPNAENLRVVSWFSPRRNENTKEHQRKATFSVGQLGGLQGEWEPLMQEFNRKLVKHA